jgi:hypothetical protein
MWFFFLVMIAVAAAFLGLWAYLAGYDAATLTPGPSNE